MGEIKFSKYKSVVEKGNRVILLNRCYGGWIKISRECYDILAEAEKNHMTKEALLKDLYDEEDREYFSKLFEFLESVEILETGNELFHQFVVTFALTNRCNLQCKHCSAAAVTAENPELLNHEEMLEVIDKILEVNPSVITLTGGEPMVRQDFFEIVDYIKAHFDGPLSLMTNGLLINEGNVDKIIDSFYTIDISIDGVDEETCSMIRGKGVFGKVIDTVKLLKKHGYEAISLSSVKSKYTLEREQDFYDMLESLGVKGVMRMYAPLGRGDDNKDELTDINNVDKLPGERTVYGIEKKDTPKILEVNSSKERKIYARACGALTNKVYIGADGYIYPCGAGSIEPFRMDNIRSIDNLKQYIEEREFEKCENYKNLKRLSPEHLEKCKDCDVSWFCVGCPVYLYLYKKNNVLDRFCDSRKDVIKKLIWGEGCHVSGCDNMGD